MLEGAKVRPISGGSTSCMLMLFYKLVIMKLTTLPEYPVTSSSEVLGTMASCELWC